MYGMPPGDRDDDDDMDGDMDVDVEVEDDAPVGGGASSVEDLARGILDTIQDLVPGLLDVQDDEEEVDMVPEPEEEALEEPEEALEEVDIVEDEDLINEVAKRVTTRLVKSLAARKNS